MTDRGPWPSCRATPAQAGDDSGESVNVPGGVLAGERPAHGVAGAQRVVEERRVLRIGQPDSFTQTVSYGG